MQEIPYEVNTEENFFYDDLLTIRKPDTDWKSKQAEANLIGSDRNLYLTEAMIREIYITCDPLIMWDDIHMGASAADLCMDSDVWIYCKNEVDDILNGDIDAYLETIEYLKPVNDLLLYGGDFEFGTDDPKYMEVEYTAYPEEILQNGKRDHLFMDYVLAVAVRIARDLMSTLPVETVIVHTMVDDEYVSSGVLERCDLQQADYRNIKASEIYKLFKTLSVIEENKKVEPLEYARLPKADNHFI